MMRPHGYTLSAVLGSVLALAIIGCAGLYFRMSATDGGKSIDLDIHPRTSTSQPATTSEAKLIGFQSLPVLALGFGLMGLVSRRRTKPRDPRRVDDAQFINPYKTLAHVGQVNFTGPAEITVDFDTPVVSVGAVTLGITIQDVTGGAGAGTLLDPMTATCQPIAIANVSEEVAPGAGRVRITLDAEFEPSACACLMSQGYMGGMITFAYDRLLGGANPALYPIYEP